MADPTDDTPDDEPDQPEDGSEPKRRGLRIEDLGWTDVEGKKPRKTEEEGIHGRPSGPQFVTKEELYRKYPGFKAEGELHRHRAREKADERDTQRDIRDQTALAAAALLAAQESTKLTTTLTAIAAGAALLALLTSLAAYRLAFGDDEHDRRWRAEQRALAAEQLRVLEEIRERLPPF